VDGTDIAELFGFSTSKCPLKVEQIEQVTAAVSFDRVTGRGKEMRRIIMHCPMIRTVQPFDWRKMLMAWWPDVMELHEGSRTYYKLKPGTAHKLGKSPSFLIGDDRTLVTDEEGAILRLIRRDAPSLPGFARGPEWKRIERDLIAIALDDHDGRTTRATKNTSDNAGSDPFAELIERTDHAILGLAESDDFLLRAVLVCRDPKLVAALHRRAENLRQTAIVSLADVEIKKTSQDPDLVQFSRMAKQVLEGLRVSHHGSEVEIEPAPGVKLADFLPLIARDGL
jgi:hypothetical protein